MLLTATAYADAPAADIGLAVVREEPVALDAISIGAHIVHRRFSLHGIPVRGAFETVRTRTGGGGFPRVVASRRPTYAPQLRPEQAVVGAQELPGLVQRALDLPLPVEPERPPELVYIDLLGHPVLAWEVHMPLVTLPEPTRQTLWISAATGRLLEEEENVRSSRALVYPENPAKTPGAIEVTLADIDVAEAGVPLVGPRVRTFNCTMQEPAVVEPWWDEGECYPIQRVFSDGAGDFFVPLPDVLDIADNIDGDDLYAELSMYFHAEKFLDTMATRYDVTAFRCELATMQANFRALEPSESTPDLEYGPVNNAYFTDQCDPEKGATMLFGQGSDVDFGFDGDVVYHELGHGIVAMLTPEGLSGLNLREDAVLVDAGGANEGIADYHTIMMTDDPQLAEYVGRFWPSMTKPYIRDATTSKVCPVNIVGEVHNEGEPLAAALWAARSRLPDPLALDRIVLETLTRLARDASLEDVARAVLDVAADHLEQGNVDDAAIELLERSFATRGLLDCPRVITDPADLESTRTMYLRKSTTIEPMVPGPMQLRARVPEDATSIELSMELAIRGSEDAPEAVVLVKRGDAPISFTYDLVTLDDAGDPTGLGDKIREVRLVGGDWDLEVPVVQVAGPQHVASLDGLQPGEIVHIAFANPLDFDVTIGQLRVAAQLDDEGVAGTSTGEADDGADVREEIGSGNAHAGGCGCGHTVAPPWWLGLLAAVRRRRRR